LIYAAAEKESRNSVGFLSRRPQSDLAHLPQHIAIGSGNYDAESGMALVLVELFVNWILASTVEDVAEIIGVLLPSLSGGSLEKGHF